MGDKAAPARVEGTSSPPRVGSAETSTTANVITTTAGDSAARTTTTSATTTLVSAAAATTTTSTPATEATTTPAVAATTTTTTSTHATEATTTPAVAETTSTTTTPVAPPTATTVAPEELAAGEEPSRDTGQNKTPASKGKAEVSMLVEVLGEELVGKNKKVLTNSLCTNNNIVGLYFSAHWCPPCRTFTPSLVDFYKKFKSSPRGDQLEIIFVSFDRSEGNFKSYFAEMPWLAVPYDEQEVRESAGANFSVSGIPSLIFVNGATGEIVQKDGRSKVSSDPNGNEFPWA